MINNSEALFVCSTCVIVQLNLCTGLRTLPGQDRFVDNPLTEFVPARRTIRDRREWPDFVYVICSGWAMTSIAYADNRQQAMNVLLPGDSESTLSVFLQRLGRAIEAITDVLYRRFHVEELKNAMQTRPDVFETLGRIWSEERERAEQLAVDLGRRSADERIARQIIDLAGRLEKRGMVSEGRMEFPLRHHHIADLAGLTPVHVGRVLKEFQRTRLIEIEGRQLAILDPGRLRRVAEYR